MNMPQRRITDKANGKIFLVGLLIILGGLGAKLYLNASDTLVIGLVLIGGSMIPGNHVVNLIRSWRKQNGGS